MQHVAKRDNKQSTTTEIDVVPVPTVLLHNHKQQYTFTVALVVEVEELQYLVKKPVPSFPDLCTSQCNLRFSTLVCIAHNRDPGWVSPSQERLTMQVHPAS